MFQIEIAPEVQKEADDALAVVAGTMELRIATEDQYAAAGELGVQIQTMKRSLEDQLEFLQEPMRKSKQEANEAMRRAKSMFEPWLVKLTGAAARVDLLMSTFRADQRRQQKLLAEKAEAEARARAREEAERRRAVAKELAEKGMAQEAWAIETRLAPVAAPVSTYTPPPPKVSGVVTKNRKAARVNVEEQFLHLKDAIDAWNAFHQQEKQIVPAEFWRLDQAALDDRADQTGGMIPIPGAEFYDVDKTVFRRKR
ncbi:MAG: hypothetical protein ACRD1P_04020 [Thermoanaerobaculia bacterium]